MNNAADGGRPPRLVWVGLLVALAIAGALMLALFAPAERAGAIANVVAAVASASAALTALHLSREALKRTDRQLALTRRAAVLSRYPLLLPIHQAVAYPESTGALASHPPARERFRLNPPSAGTYAFLADTKDRLVIPVENAGEGPALRISGLLWRHDGRCGGVVGPTVLGAGKVMVATATLTQTRRLPERFADAVKAVVDGFREGDPFYVLEMVYSDVFGNELSAWAVFDTSGPGAWRHVGVPVVEPSPPAPGAE